MSARKTKPHTYHLGPVDSATVYEAEANGTTLTTYCGIDKVPEVCRSVDNAVVCVACLIASRREVTA